MAHSKSMFFRDAFDASNKTTMEVYGFNEGVVIAIGESTETTDYMKLDFEDVKALITELQSLLPETEEV
jgi:hypothetical protein